MDSEIALLSTINAEFSTIADFSEIVAGEVKKFPDASEAIVVDQFGLGRGSQSIY